MGVLFLGQRGAGPGWVRSTSLLMGAVTQYMEVVLCASNMLSFHIHGSVCIMGLKGLHINTLQHLW